MPLGWWSARCRRQDSASDGDRATSGIEDGEYDTAAQEVLCPTPLVDEAKARSLKDLLRGPKVPAELIPVVGSPANAELSDDLRVIATTSQVAASHTGVWGIEEAVVEERHRPLHRLEKGRPILAVGPAALILVQGDPRSVGEHAHGIDEGQTLGLLHEGDGIAGDLATKALVVARGRTHVE